MSDTDRERLMGWKAIGNFVGRDARTVRRWGAERGLPVHRLPGGSSASVWVYADDLRDWMTDDTKTGQSAPAPAPRTWRARHIWALATSTLAVAVAVPLTMSYISSAAVPRQPEVLRPYGRDDAANAAYSAARYTMNTRSVAGLQDAARSFEDLTRKYPDNAAAFIGIADTNLLLREFNTIPQEIAYRRATTAAQRALAIDPAAPGALRALGFVKYWSDGSYKTGLDLLHRAMLASPNDAQSHHWYGTALFGEGRFRDAVVELDRAHAIDPGSSAIATDEAVVLYRTGQRSAAMTMLLRVARVDPGFSGAHAHLADYYLIEGNSNGFLTEAAITAQLKRDADGTKTVEAAAKAFASGGRPAMMASLVADAERSFERTGEGAIAIARLYAASGNRNKVLAWLARAAALGEPDIRSIRCYAVFVRYQNDPDFRRFFDPN